MRTRGSFATRRCTQIIIKRTRYKLRHIAAVYSWEHISSRLNYLANYSAGSVAPPWSRPPPFWHVACRRRAKRPLGYFVQSDTVTPRVPGLSFTLPPGRSPVSDLENKNYTSHPETHLLFSEMRGGASINCARSKAKADGAPRSDQVPACRSVARSASPSNNHSSPSRRRECLSKIPRVTGFVRTSLVWSAVSTNFTDTLSR